MARPVVILHTKFFQWQSLLTNLVSREALNYLDGIDGGKAKHCGAKLWCLPLSLPKISDLVSTIGPLSHLVLN